MADQPPGAVTRLFHSMRNGNRQAEAEIIELLHAELVRLARAYMRRERHNHTLQPSALVNEAYIRLLGHESPDWQNRAHFLGYAARAMRQVLVDHARAHCAAKRGGRLPHVSLDDAIADANEPVDTRGTKRHSSPEELIALDQALNELAALDQRQAEIVELSFFTGLGEKEIAASLGVSERTVRRERLTAKCFLRQRIEGEGA